MRVSTRWLKDYVKHNYTPGELAEKLTMTGSEVEQVITIGEDLPNVVVGKIEKIGAHPDADDLVICSVNVGRPEYVNIITHAPNVREDCCVPVALPGAILPGGMEVKEVPFRGVNSSGMLCSEAELGLGEDTSGIMILPDDLTPGSDLIDALDAKDTVIDFEITPNRPDCLSMLGIAREVSTICQEPVLYPEVTIDESSESADRLIDISIEDEDLCLRYSARIITDVKIGPSPAWLQRRLRAGGMRPINNIVDITNYCLLEYGQPLHAFDYDLIRGKEIIVRCAREGETITTLDEEERLLDTDILAICDSKGPVAIGGVMGGLDSEVTESTRTILLESANFNPVSIRRTSQKLGIRTEASSRFEKDLDLQGTVEPLNRAAYLIQELAGGKVLSGLLDAGQSKSEDRLVVASVNRVNSILGTNLDKFTMKSILESLDFKVSIDESNLKVTPPYFRKDILIEADIIEEIARIYGYNKIEATLPVGRITGGGASKGLEVADKTRGVLIGFGLTEVITYSFIHPNAYDKIKLTGDDPRRNSIKIKNPLVEEQSGMRTTLLPGLLEVLATNESRGIEDVSIFEVGAVYLKEEDETAENAVSDKLPRESKVLGIALKGNRWNAGWDMPGRQVDFFDLKGVLQETFKSLGIVDFSLGTTDIPSLHPGQRGLVFLNNRPAGIVGKIHPDVMDEYELSGSVYIAEIDIEVVIDEATSEKRYKHIIKYPATVRDIAVVVPEKVAAGDIEHTIRMEGSDLVENVKLFDVYRGKQIKEGYKSLAYSVTYRAEDRTLTDEEVNEIYEKTVAKLKGQFDAGIRS